MLRFIPHIHARIRHERICLHQLIHYILSIRESQVYTYYRTNTQSPLRLNPIIPPRTRLCISKHINTPLHPIPPNAPSPTFHKLTPPIHQLLQPLSPLFPSKRMVAPKLKKLGVRSCIHETPITSPRRILILSPVGSQCKW